MLVFHQSFLGTHLTVDHVEQCVNNSVFQTEHNVEVLQSNVCIYHAHFVTQLSERTTKVGGHRCLANPTLSRRDDDDFSHERSPP